MSSKRLLLPLTLCLGALLVGCASDDPSTPETPVVPPPPPPDLNVVGEHLGASPCKYHDKDDAYLDWECLIWDLATDSTLYLTHVNRIMNCFQRHEASVSIHDGLVTISETEIEGMANCECLFDFLYAVPGVPAGRFNYVVINGNVGPDQVTLAGTFDLASQPSGVQCEPRDHGIWH